MFVSILQTASHTGPLPVQTDTSLFVVTGLANKLLLTKEILDFCGALPIYQTELYTGASNENGTASKHDRQENELEALSHSPCPPLLSTPVQGVPKVRSSTL